MFLHTLLVFDVIVRNITICVPGEYFHLNYSCRVSYTTGHYGGN